MPVSSPDLTAMTLSLASAKKSCTGWQHKPKDRLSSPDEVCGDCEGTGELYVLGDGVRVECPGDFASLGLGWFPQPTGTHGDPKGTYSKCDCPDGRGWDPEDPEKLGRWMVALAKVGHPITSEPNFADTPEEAFFQAAMKALSLDTEE